MQVDKILAMGGYGIYVWATYGLTLVVFGINVILYLKEGRQVKRRIFHYWSKQK
jgi:heme exporter protein CcmD